MIISFLKANVSASLSIAIKQAMIFIRFTIKSIAVENNLGDFLNGPKGVFR